MASSSSRDRPRSKCWISNMYLLLLSAPSPLPKDWIKSPGLSEAPADPPPRCGLGEPRGLRGLARGLRGESLIFGGSELRPANVGE